MRKTCMNCTKYHETLLNDERDFHVHDWCAQWETVLDVYALSGTMDYECPFCNDLETGDAFCYMFEAVDTPRYPDEWFDKNKAKNEQNANRINQ